jgi:hypothetical protein
VDDRFEIPSRPRPGARALGDGAQDDGTVALLIGAGKAVVVVTAAIALYGLELAVASTRATWSRMGEVAGRLHRDPDERVTVRR